MVTMQTIYVSTCFQRIRPRPLFVFTSIISVINTSDLLIKLTFLPKLVFCYFTPKEEKKQGKNLY